MNASPIPAFLRLSIGGSSSVTAAAVAAVAAVSSSSRTSVRHASTYYRRFRKPQPELTKFRPGHGEQIWIFNHVMTNQVVYSHSPILRANRALDQLPFNGKKTKPAKLRKDYWQPMALVQFSPGAGVVGQSVFQKLREFRRLHELEWGHQAAELYRMDRRERGRALGDQKANSVADLAAVLAGAGRGNRIRLEERGNEKPETAGEGEGKAVAVAEAEGSEGKQQKLAEATIYWANAQDRDFAESWSDNITHALGLPSLKGSVEAAEAEHAPEEVLHEEAAAAPKSEPSPSPSPA